MANVLDLKHRTEEESAPTETARRADGISAVPTPAPEEPEPADALSEASEYLKKIHQTRLSQETAWHADVRPDELERRKEHALLATLGAVGIGVAVWSGSVALAGIVGLTVLAWEVHHRTHHEVDVHVGERGITVNGHRHPYEKLHSFHIQELPDSSVHLSVRPAGIMRPGMRFPLGDHDQEEIRAVLSQYLVEEEHPIPLSELFLKY